MAGEGLRLQAGACRLHFVWQVRLVWPPNCRVWEHGHGMLGWAGKWLMLATTLTPRCLKHSQPGILVDAPSCSGGQSWRRSAAPLGIARRDAHSLSACLISVDSSAHPAAPGGRPLPKVAQPGRKMLRSGSAALQRLTRMVGKSRQIYKVGACGHPRGSSCPAGVCAAWCSCVLCGPSTTLRPRWAYGSGCRLKGELPGPYCGAGHCRAVHPAVPRLRLALCRHGRGGTVRAAQPGEHAAWRAWQRLLRAGGRLGLRLVAVLTNLLEICLLGLLLATRTRAELDP